MKSTLVFKASEVKPLVEHAEKCELHSPIYEQMFDGRYRKDGRDIDTESGDEWPTSEDVDMAKVPAALHLVTDNGVYLLSGGFPRDIVDGKSSRVAYAKDLDPTVESDEDWYDNKRRIMGGDDQVMIIPLDWIKPQLEAGETVKIWVKTNGMYVEKLGVNLK